MTRNARLRNESSAREVPLLDQFEVSKKVSIIVQRRQKVHDCGLAEVASLVRGTD